ncbi:hypothetical protein [Flagellimonas sp. CMM7]|uniref:hypothetical protein n=1 Tax=Flagellimonas sp. CMM7 TaxID=2654676 RepID=UPI001969CBC7|nr:hypothetical protein [Flagellimonas sp. CMM7]UII80214.1 hypothetical protein LV704_01555 [Flagellimonas sp. CMM7]
MKKLIPTLVLFVLASQLYGQIERDKALHFLGGSLFGLAGAGIAKQASDGNRVWTFVGAVAGSTLIGLAKETVDAGQRDNGWDNDDLLATILGGVTVGVAIEVFSKKRNKRLRGSFTTEHIETDVFQVNVVSENLLVDYEELPSLTTFGLSSTFLRSYLSP